MLLSPQQIAQTRDLTLSNLLGLSSACIAAGHRFSELLATTGREALHHNSKQFALLGHGQLDALSHFPTSLWLEGSARHSRLLDNAYAILGEAHKALIQSTEEQVRVIDKLIFTSINRVAKGSPWEAEIALNAMRSLLESAEQTLHSVSVAAVESVDIAEPEVHQISENVTEEKSPRKRSTPRTSTTNS